MYYTFKSHLLTKRDIILLVYLPQLNCLIDDMKQETELLRSQFNSERASVKNLEEILQTNREKEFQCQLATQEKSAEAQMLKDRLSLNESKM